MDARPHRGSGQEAGDRESRGERPGGQSGVTGGARVITASNIVNDEPTTFFYDNQSYSPKDFEKTFHGPVTLRYALAHSLNTVRSLQFAPC